MVVLLTSSRTEESVLKVLSRFATEVEVTWLKGEVASASLDALEPGLVLDFTNSPSLSMSLRQGCRVLARWINGNSYFVEGEEDLFTPNHREIQALAVVAMALGMTRPCLFLPPEMLWAEEVFANSMLPAEVTVLVLSKELFGGSLDTLVRKEVKGRGFLNLIIAQPSDTALALLQALANNHMERSPLELLLSQDASRARGLAQYPDLAKIGTFLISAPGCETSTKDADARYCRLRQIFNNTDMYSVVSMQNGTERLIGTATSSLASICAGCFSRRPGWNPSLIRSPLQVSFNNGTLNPNGDTNNGERQWYLGAELALTDVNADTTMLPEHYLRFFNMSLGMSIYNASWSLKQAKKYNEEDYGLAFMHSQYSGVTVPLYDLLFTNLSIRVPQVGSTQLTPQLSSTKRYPYFSRVVLSTDYFAVLYIKLIQHYGWKQLVVMYCDDLFCKDLYATFSALANKTGLVIVNPPDSRRYPSNMYEYPSDRLADYQQIVDSKARVVLMMLYGSALFYSLDVFYDLGVRRGDLFFMSTTWLTPTLFTTTGTDDALARRKELLAGTVQCYPVGFYGPHGQAVQKRFVDTFHMQPANKACLYYDELLSIAHAINDLMVIGKDYEDPWTLAKALKSVRFMGCSGDVSMQDGTNDRSPMRFQILNALSFEDGTVKIVEVGIYDPVGVVMFNFTRPIVWPDNTTIVPTDTRLSLIDCPFDQKEVVTFRPGLALAYSVLLTVSLIAILITLAIWRWYWLSPAKKLETRVEISFDDYILFTTIALEALQYAEMGPPFPASLALISTLSEALSWKLDSLLYIRKGVYWLILNGVLGCVLGWVLLVALAKTGWGDVLRRKIWLLDAACEKILPILGNLCFLPIVSTLLNVYLCVEAVDRGGDVGFTDTFLYKDCYQTCWKFPHFIYAISASIALFCYVPSAVYFRPTWQDFQPSLHVFSTPAHLMTKSIYQLALVAGSKILHDYQSLGHSVFFFCVTVAYFLTSWKWRPFGYSRANLWNDISLVCVLWLSIVAFVNLLNEYIPSIIYMAVFGGGVAVCVVFGLLYQHFRLPAMLFRSKGIHVVDLFKFQFSRGTKWLYLFARRRQADQDPDENSARRLELPAPFNHQIYPTFQPPPAE